MMIVLSLLKANSQNLKKIRFRTLGCYPLTAAIESNADTLDAVIAETLAAKSSERQGRLIDSDQAGSMEKKKTRGLFLVDTLRFITCGSVDDGKSTLIGRLLFESKSIFEDQMQSLKKDSKQYGTQGDDVDFALLVDGLQAEREQGITIDVAYRFFATDKRKYIVADIPGHEQYTRNMATGASTAQVAIILVDARKGILTQTRRHSRIVSLMGIKQVVLAVNKMDLIAFHQDAYQVIVDDYLQFAQGLGFDAIDAIPVSGLTGDNVFAKSQAMSWYTGQSLMHYLDNLELKKNTTAQAFRLPVQYVNRPNLDFRGYCGTVAQGSIAVGDTVRVLPSGCQTQIKAILLGFDAVEQAKNGDAITLSLTDELDISRGDVLVGADATCEVADQFEVDIIWFAEQSLHIGRQYLMKLHCKEVIVSITNIKYKQDINTGSHLAANQLAMNDIACLTLSTSQPVVFEPYAQNKTLGAFILMDKYNHDTLAAGMIKFVMV